MSEGDFIGRLGGQITFKAELPQEFYDKIIGNTPEEMDRMLQPGYEFDLSDGKDRAVTYIAFPKGTKPEDVAQIVHCGKCRRWGPPIPKEMEGIGFKVGYCGALWSNTKEDDYCVYGEKRKDKNG